MQWIDLGIMEYADAWAFQRQLAQARASDEIDDTLILVQHPHTYTLGSSGHIENLLMGEAEREQLGVTVHKVDRGGDITYHGPGQLVAYPILALGSIQSDGRLPQADYVGYIRSLEQVIINMLAEWGITSRREAGFSGVWVDTPDGPEKIAAIGVKITASGISMHGVAINVDPDLRFFAGIVPCGISDKGVTTVSRLLGDACPSIPEARMHFRKQFEIVFKQHLHEVSAEAILAATK